MNDDTPIQKDPETGPGPAEEGDPEDEREKPADDDTSKEIVKNLKPRVASSKRNRRQYYTEWKRNIELRIGKIASQYTGGVNIEDDVQTEVNPDWSLTKTKTANLFSQVPTVTGTHENKQFAAAVPPFVKSLNFELQEKRTHIAVPMEEALNDVVNASGVAAAYVSYVALFDETVVPAIDTSLLPPDIMHMGMEQGLIPMKKVSTVSSYRFNVERISPSNILWPSEFLGSDFNRSDWLGYTGTYTWSETKREFGLDDALKNKIMKSPDSDIKTEDDLRSQPEKGSITDVSKVRFDHVFYRRHLFDTECTNLDEIWEIVWLDGLDTPARHRLWNGQEYSDNGKLIGSRIYPLQFLTLTYISDNPIPPSDSSAGRPQVNDMRRSRSQMFQQRERSLPVRWYNPDKVDPLVADTLMRGTWQGMIPTLGDGARSIGEIARASYPTENIEFDMQNKQDLTELWGLGPNQTGTPSGKQTKAQVESIQANFATRVGIERNRVGMFFLRLCEVISGFMVLYSDFPILTDEERATMQKAWDNKHITSDLVLKIRPDSTIVLDTQAMIQRRMMFLNMAGKSGLVNPLPILTELAELSGLDPADVIIQPQPKPPEDNISFRFTGKEDLSDPKVMAMLVKNGRAPNPEHLTAAKKILAASQLSLEEEAALQAAQPPQPGAPQPPHPPGGGAPPHLNNPQTPPEARPEWSAMSKIAKRSRDVAEGSK